MNIDHADLLDASGAFDNEEDEASYRRWLDAVMADQEWNKRQVEKMTDGAR